jgi:hypothetical protein
MKLKDRIEELFQELLLTEMDRHIKNDERVNILGGGYWTRWLKLGEPHHMRFYASQGIEHEMPVFKRPLGDEGQQEIMLAPEEGVIVTTIIGNTRSAGIWLNREFTELHSD